MTTGEQGDVGRTGDSSTRGVAGTRDEEGCRKGDEARAWERKGWCEAHGQGQIVRRSKIHTEQLEPKYGPWVGCNPLSGEWRDCQPGQDEGKKCQWARWMDWVMTEARGPRWSRCQRYGRQGKGYKE